MEVFNSVLSKIVWLEKGALRAFLHQPTLLWPEAWEEKHRNATYEEAFLGVCDDNPFFWDENTLPELLNRDARKEFFRKMKKSFTDCLVDANDILNHRDDIATEKQRFFMTIQAFQPLKETLREMEPT